MTVNAVSGLVFFIMDCSNSVSDNGSFINFSDAEVKTLNECENFAQTLLSVVHVWQQGYTYRELPCFPKSYLHHILALSKLHKAIRGLELHAYLKSKLMLVERDIPIPIPIHTYIHLFVSDTIGP